MSEMEVQPDPIVRTALQRLPIPAHTDGFWARLDEVLAAEASPAALPRDQRTVLVAVPDHTSGSAGDEVAPRRAPEPDPALALVPPALRRTSNGVLLAVAAAAVVVVALAGTALLEQRNGTTGVATDEVAQPSVALDALMSEAQGSDVTLAAMSAEGEEASSEAVLSWVDDLGTGDGASAWQAMGPASQAHFGSQDAFESEMGSLAERYGAWSTAAPDDVLVTPVGADDEGTVAVVTLIGVVDQGGTAERQAVALPVRVVAGEAVLEPFAFAGVIEVVVPDEAPVQDDDALVVVVPRGAEAPVLRVDDGATVVCGRAEGSELADIEGSASQRCSYLPPEGLDAGEHTLTTACRGSDGTSIAAASVLFDAA